MKAPCPNCGLEYTFDERLFGRRIRCGLCGDRFCLPTHAQYTRKMWLTLFVGAAMFSVTTGGYLYLHSKIMGTDTSRRDPRESPPNPVPLPVVAAGKAETLVSVNEDEPAAARKLNRAKQLLAEGNRPMARDLLSDVVKDHPSTRSAVEARLLLTQFTKDVAVASSANE